MATLVPGITNGPRSKWNAESVYFVDIGEVTNGDEELRDCCSDGPEIFANDEEVVKYVSFRLERAFRSGVDDILWNGTYFYDVEAAMVIIRANPLAAFEELQGVA